ENAPATPLHFGRGSGEVSFKSVHATEVLADDVVEGSARFCCALGCHAVKEYEVEHVARAVESELILPVGNEVKVARFARLSQFGQCGIEAFAIALEVDIVMQAHCLPVNMGLQRFVRMRKWWELILSIRIHRCVKDAVFVLRIVSGFFCGKGGRSR